MDIKVQRVNLSKEATHLSKMDVEIFGTDGFADPSNWWGLKCFWLVVDGAKVGSVAIRHNSAVSEHDDYTMTPGSIWIVSTGILSKFQGRGLGSYLKAWEVKYAKSKGFKRVITNCRKSNHKILNLNKKFGFSRVSTIKGYYENPDEDAVVLELQIKP